MVSEVLRVQKVPLVLLEWPVFLVTQACRVNQGLLDKLDEPDFAEKVASLEQVDSQDQKDRPDRRVKLEAREQLAPGVWLGPLGHLVLKVHVVELELLGPLVTLVAADRLETSEKWVILDRLEQREFKVLVEFPDSLGSVEQLDCQEREAILGLVVL